MSILELIMDYHNVSASQLARDLDVTHVTIKRWHKDGVSRQKINKVANYFQIEPELLYYGDQHPIVIQEKIKIYEKMVSKHIGIPVKIIQKGTNHFSKAKVKFNIQGMEMKTIVDIPDFRDDMDDEEIIEIAVNQVKSTFGLNLKIISDNLPASTTIERS